VGKISVNDEILIENLKKMGLEETVK